MFEREREGLKTDQSNFLSEPNADNELVEDSLAKFVKVKRLSSVLIFLDFFFLADKLTYEFIRYE